MVLGILLRWGIRFFGKLEETEQNPEGQEDGGSKMGPSTTDDELTHIRVEKKTDEAYLDALNATALDAASPRAT